MAHLYNRSKGEGSLGYKLDGRLNKLFCEALVYIIDDDALTEAIKVAIIKNSACIELVYRVYSKFYRIDESIDDSMPKKRNIPPLSEILSECEAVHSHYKENLSESSKFILEQQFSENLLVDKSKSRKGDRLIPRDELKSLEKEMARFIYGMFATFGTGAAVYLAFNMFTDWPMEHKLIASIVMACIVSIYELIRFIKYACI
jgi:hypothetical protein